MKKGEPVTARADKLAWLDAVISEDGEGCRDWPWAKTAKGYGRLCFNGGARLVGHLVLHMSGRPRPSLEYHQLHSCDRPTCAAPWHLSWGTNAENRQESIERGRHFTKLTPEQVLVIYRSKERQRDVAAMFGVTQRVVWQIKHGHTWSRVTGHGGRRDPRRDLPHPPARARQARRALARDRTPGGGVMSETCQSACWMETVADDAYCELPVGHDGPHLDTFEGWEW